MTIKTTTKASVTDDEGGILHVYPWASGRMSLVARDGDHRVEFGPVERHVLLDAIREAAGETDDKPEPAPAKSPTAEDFAKAEFARHEDGRIAARLYVDSLAWRSSPGPWADYWQTDAEMAAEGGWSIVTPAEDSISRAELDARLARRDGKHERQVARMQRHIETVQRHLARRREQMDQMREQMEAMTPAPSTPREALALVADLAYEPEGDTMPDQRGYMMVGEDGRVEVLPTDNPVGMPARGTTYRRLLLDPPAPVTPAWHNARIVEATCRGRACQWARTRTDGLWVSLDGESREAYTPDLSDVTVVVPGEVRA